MNGRPFARPRRGGFTVLELTIAGVLTGLLAVMLFTAYSAYDRAATDVMARCRLAQEADLAILAIADDLGSRMGPTPAGPKGRGRTTDFQIAPDHGGIRIYFEDAGSPENSRVVVYEIREEVRDLPRSKARIRRRQLVRRVEALQPQALIEPPRIVAWDTKRFDSVPISSGWQEIRITLELPTRRGGTAGPSLERTYSLVAILQ